MYKGSNERQDGTSQVGAWGHRRRDKGAGDEGKEAEKNTYFNKINKKEK